MPVRRTATSRSSVQRLTHRIEELAGDLWWTWNADARRLLAGLEPSLWAATGRNPIAALRRLTPERIETLAGDDAFLARLTTCERQRAAYYAARPWFDRTFRGRRRSLRVAYFCSEYALDDCLPLYAGGLGVLAGDHLKSASDLGVPLVAVGLLYRSGYFRQELRHDGSSRAVYPRFDFADWPIEDTGRTVAVTLGSHAVSVRVWRAHVGRVPLLLLDTDVPQNPPRDRSITQALYGGDDDVRIRQQIVLGVGGVAALRTMGYAPTVYHLNEGHAAFCQLPRLVDLRRVSESRDDAITALRRSSVFTTHTPVPAGNQRFDNRLVLRYLGPTADELGMSREEFLGLGREDPRDRREPFCMTVLALRLSGHCNGVARLHGDVSRRMWMRMYRARTPAHVPIGHVTNGIHAQTWLAPEALPLYEKHLTPRWADAGPDERWWERAERIPPAELWRLRNRLRARLVAYVRAALREQILRNSGSREEWIEAVDVFDEHTLTIGFARRFATYKRASLIFRDPRRLAAILGHPTRPVQIVFAGKAHPRDAGGQALVQTVYRMSRRAGLRGRVVLLENYDMQMGQVLTSGCDVWLNTPLRPHEASGTSGMKPPLHGGINCSILDGWWPEAYDRRNGWAIGDERERPSQAAQDRYDADCLYALLERTIVPLFYRRDRAGIPRQWMRMALHSMKTVCGTFNTHRMLGEYVTKYYLPAHA